MEPLVGALAAPKVTMLNLPTKTCMAKTTTTLQNGGTSWWIAAAFTFARAMRTPRKNTLVGLNQGVDQWQVNFSKLPMKTHIYTAASANVGRIKLGKELLEEFKHFEVISGDQRPDREDVKLHLGIYYHCRVRYLLPQPRSRGLRVFCMV